MRCKTKIFVTDFPIFVPILKEETAFPETKQLALGKPADLQKQCSWQIIHEFNYWGIANADQRIQLYYGEEHGNTGIENAARRG